MAIRVGQTADDSNAEDAICISTAACQSTRSALSPPISIDNMTQRVCPRLCSKLVHLRY